MAALPKLVRVWQTQVEGVTSASLPITVPTGGPYTLIVFLGRTDADTPLSFFTNPSLNSISATILGTLGSSTTTTVRFYRLVSPTSGTMSVTFSDPADAAFVVALLYRHAGTPTVTSSNQGDTVTTGVTFPATTRYVGGLWRVGATSITLPTGYTRVAGIEPLANGLGAFVVASAPGPGTSVSYTPTYSPSSGTSYNLHVAVPYSAPTRSQCAGG